MSIVIRGNSGIGDSLLLYPIVKELVKDNSKQLITILTNFPEIFQTLPEKNINFHPFIKFLKADYDCNYVPRKAITETNQYQDMVLQGHLFLDEYPEFSYLDGYKNTTQFIFNNKDKKICLIVDPYLPMNSLKCRADLMPDYSRYQEIINQNKDKYYFITVGKRSTDYDYPLNGIDKDMRDKTIWPALCSLFKKADLIIGQLGVFLHLAEMLDKKYYLIMNHNQGNSEDQFFRTITEKKIVMKPELTTVIQDNVSEQELNDIFK